MKNEDIYVPKNNGIVGETVEETIENMGQISSPGMVKTDEVILDMMMEKEKMKIK